MRLVEMTKENRTEALRFLKAHEDRAIALTERALKDKDGVYLLVEDKTTIAGVFSLSRGGTVLHCLPFALKLSARSKTRIGEATQILSPFFAENEVFCVSGEADGSELIENAIRLAATQKVYEARKYYRMEYDSDKDTYRKREEEFSAKEAEKQEKEERANLYGIEYFSEKTSESLDETLALRDTGTIVKCGVQDLQQLLPLEEQYQKIEVLPEGFDFDAENCRLGLLAKLKYQDVWADKIGVEVVAKAGTNAKGLGWVQIGGVYTKPLYRKLGIAGKLVSHIAREEANNGKSTALFVKELNTQALHAYERAGFVKRGSWRIVYYN